MIFNIKKMKDVAQRGEKKYSSSGHTVRDINQVLAGKISECSL